MANVAALTSPAAPLMATLPHMATLPNRADATLQFDSIAPQPVVPTLIGQEPPLRPAPIIPVLPRRVAARPRRRTALWVAVALAIAAAVVLAIVIGGSSSDSTRSSNRRTGRSAEGQRPTANDSGKPRGLAKLNLAELRARLKEAGYTVDTVVERSNELGETAELTAHRDAASAQILSTKFAELEMAVSAQESLTEDGYASHREDSAVLSVRIAGDATASRTLLDKLR
jgi:hypothetical protein